MNQWCIKQHGQVHILLVFIQTPLIRVQSGLTRACLESPFPVEEVSQHVLRYVQKWIPTGKIGVLAGNSVHVDRLFLVEAMPELINWLHYR
jgi:oligoribonuclease